MKLLERLKVFNTRNQRFTEGDLVDMFSDSYCHTDYNEFFSQIGLDNMVMYYAHNRIPVGKRYKLIAIAKHPYDDRQGTGLFKGFENNNLYIVGLNDHDMRRVY
jgi:hypothetical protein